jgi:hypothetical protein
MTTILLVGLFALGVALLLQSANMLSLHRSGLPASQRGAAGPKSAVLIVAGATCVAVALTMFIMRTMSSP